MVLYTVKFQENIEATSPDHAVSIAIKGMLDGERGNFKVGIEFEEYSKAVCPSCGRPNGSGHSGQCLIDLYPREEIKRLYEENLD